MTTELIIDTDAGIDDAQAILLALGTPGVTVAAITTLSGNVHVDKVTRNVLLTLHAADQQIPVYRGADRPLVKVPEPAEDVHGGDGLANLKLPDPPGHVENEHAALALIRIAAAHPGRYTLVAIGPLTNVALATRLDPAFPRNLAGFVFMGGAYAAHGNTNYVAEFNIHTDPEAAAVVLGAFPYATMISWELSLDGGIPLEKIHALQQIKNPAPTLKFFNAISGFLAGVNAQYGLQIMPMPDPIAVALAIDPTLAADSAEVEVHIELAGALTRGQTVINWRGQPRVKVVKAIDGPRFWNMLKNAIGVG